jgi:CRP-like cAMP-binding protein
LLQIVGDSANLFWPAGSLVYEAGAPSEGLYIVVSGVVRVLEAGRELAVLGPGDYFGELSLLLGSDHQRDVQATEDSELMVVPRERFEALVVENPALGERIRRRAEERAAANTSAAADA